MRTRDAAAHGSLYRQIAEHFRYGIATGRLKAGQRLPSARAAAKQWNVNLHTVRRAYAELATEGLVEIRVPEGTIVRRNPAPTARLGKLDAFLKDTVDRARKHHRLSAAELARLLDGWSERRQSPVVHVLECGRSQAEGHAQEIAAAFDVEARGAAFGSLREAPAGAVVATYFHYNDLRVRWPARLAEIRFAAIRPDPAITGRVAGPRKGTRATLLLCETEEGKARSIAADLSLLFSPADYRIEPQTVQEPGELLKGPSRTPVLFAPRIWDRLSESQQSDPRAVEVRYMIPPEEMSTLGAHFGWHPRR